MKPKICITEKEFNKAKNIFISSEFDFIPVKYDESTVSRAIVNQNCFAAVLGVELYIDGLYKALLSGGLIARFGVGHDGIDKQKSTENRLIVTNTPGVLDDSVAEHAIMLMGAFARNISMHDRDMKNNDWQPVIGNELRGKNLLIFGCGLIGRKTAKIASFGFGMNVSACDVANFDKDQLKCECGIEQIVSNPNNALAQADYISLHIPSIPSTRHLVNERFLSKLKPGCVLINTARGPIIDEIALYDALKAGKLAGAALDVFENEPFVPVNSDKDLRHLGNVILTPHVGSSTVEACQRMAQCCLKNIKAAYEKRYDQLDILNPEVLKKLK